MKAEAQDSVLARILAGVRQDLAARAGEAGDWERGAARAGAPRDFVAALGGGGASVAVIAEVKRRSPSAGGIRVGADAVGLARQYANAGAAAVSVLTEAAWFGGSLDDLTRVAREVPVPVLRKDFVVHRQQLFEARACGAAAVLLIARVLPEEQLTLLSGQAREIGLATLIEVHGADELGAALRAGADAIGINARDLDTLAMDPGLAEVLLPLVPPGVRAVAESGLAGRADVERVALLGADAVLVGTAFAGASDPAAMVRAFCGVERRGRVDGHIT